MQHRRLTQPPYRMGPFQQALDHSLKTYFINGLYIDVGRSSHPGKRGLKKHMHQAVTAELKRGMRVYRRYDWTRQLDEILEQGYRLGPFERKKVVDWNVVEEQSR